jgi:ribosomal protein L35AE/L33A
MADITIKDLTAGTPILTDLLIFANPTTGLAKKTTLTTFKSSLSLYFADLNDYTVANLLDEQILIYDSGDWKNSSLKTINGNNLFGSGDIVISGGSGLTSLNALTASTQTFAVGTSGTDFTISSASSTHTFNLPSASAANRGLLTAANWTTFNNKQAALVSGTNIKTINGQTILGSGDISTGFFVDWGDIQGDIINQPDVQPKLESGINIKTINGTSILGSGNIVISGGTGLTSLNALTAGTQLFAIASTGTDFTITSSSNTHTFAIPTASASARGLLSSANWTTFNSKQDALVSGTNIKTVNGTSLLGSGNITTGTGTVTSVGLSVSVAAFTLTAASNPITTSGTFTIGAAGDSTQYINGAGNLVTFPTFNSTSLVIKTVRNQTGATLAAGTVVYINGASGNVATVAKADNTTDAASAQTIGVTQAAISNNSNGVIVLIGDVSDLNTSSFADGTQLYLGTNGTFTSTKPYAPTHLVYVGIVTRSHATQGVISVKIQNGYELDELHDVSAQSPANNDGIFFNTSTSLWEKKSISTVLGFTPQASLITTNRQTASYTLVLADANKLVELNVATANTLTVPLNSSVAFPIGTQILVSQYGAGACTITAASGVSVRSEGSKLKTNGQYSGATLIKIGTDEWYAFGNLIV